MSGKLDSNRWIFKLHFLPLDDWFKIPVANLSVPDSLLKSSASEQVPYGKSDDRHRDDHPLEQ